MIERFEDLDLFTRIVEAGSLSAAARGLGTTQPTVSKRLAAMERALGVRLLQRSTHRVQLTEEGQRWYEACRRWLSELKDVSAQLTGEAHGVTGTLRVNAPVALGQLVLTPLVLRFLAQHAQLQVDLTLDDRRVDLVGQNVDVAVRIGPIAASQMVARRLMDYRARLVAAPAYLARQGRPRSVPELLAHRVLVYGPPFEEEVDGPGGKVRVRADVRFRTNDAVAFVAGVEAGLGLGLANPWLLAAPLARGTLVPVLEEAAGERFAVHAVYVPSRVLPARVRAFVRFLERELPRAMAGLPGVRGPDGQPPRA